MPVLSSSRLTQRIGQYLQGHSQPPRASLAQSQHQVCVGATIQLAAAAWEWRSAMPEREAERLLHECKCNERCSTVAAQAVGTETHHSCVPGCAALPVTARPPTRPPTPLAAQHQSGPPAHAGRQLDSTSSSPPATESLMLRHRRPLPHTWARCRVLPRQQAAAKSGDMRAPNPASCRTAGHKRAGRGMWLLTITRQLRE